VADQNDDMTDKEKMEFVFRFYEDDEVLENWDRQVATSLALEEGIALTDEQWEVVSYLRKLYEGTGKIDYARDLSAVLDQRFKSAGGLKHLFTLFPKGPVSQGCRIAGLPVPKDSSQPSMGTVS